MTIGYAILLLLLNMTVPVILLYWLAHLNNLIEYNDHDRE